MGKSGRRKDKPTPWKIEWFCNMCCVEGCIELSATTKPEDIYELAAADHKDRIESCAKMNGCQHLKFRKANSGRER